jgi:hypothetical protein
LRSSGACPTVEGMLPPIVDRDPDDETDAV